MEGIGGLRPLTPLQNPRESPKARASSKGFPLGSRWLRHLFALGNPLGKRSFLPLPLGFPKPMVGWGQSPQTPRTSGWGPPRPGRPSGRRPGGLRPLLFKLALRALGSPSGWIDSYGGDEGGSPPSNPPWILCGRIRVKYTHIHLIFPNIYQNNPHNGSFFAIIRHILPNIAHISVNMTENEFNSSHSSTHFLIFR